MYVRDDYVIYFDSFGFEHVPKEINKFIENKNIKEKFSLSDYTNLFSPNQNEKNDKTILKCFQ